MLKLHPVSKLLIIILSTLFLGHVMDLYLIDSILPEHFFEFIIELIPDILYFSIFAMTWSVYNKSKDNHSLFLGTVFL